MRKFITISGKKIDEFFFKNFEDAKRNADDDEIIIEVDVKEIRRFKKGGWQEIKEPKN